MIPSEVPSKINILVTDDCRCCLADFGLAITVESHSAAGTSSTIRGTPHWQAPELMKPTDPRFQNAIKEARDIYAFACTVYEVYFLDIVNHINLNSLMADLYWKTSIFRAKGYRSNASCS